MGETVGVNHDDIAFEGGSLEDESRRLPIYYALALEESAAKLRGRSRFFAVSTTALLIANVIALTLIWALASSEGNEFGGGNVLTAATAAVAAAAALTGLLVAYISTERASRRELMSLIQLAAFSLEQAERLQAAERKEDVPKSRYAASDGESGLTS